MFSTLECCKLLQDGVRMAATAVAAAAGTAPSILQLISTLGVPTLLRHVSLLLGNLSVW
jgi:hypothetical protein